jgi:hypothetical protein
MRRSISSNAKRVAAGSIAAISAKSLSTKAPCPIRRRISRNVTRAHFAFRIDRWDQLGDNILDHVAGIEDFQVAQATFEAACKGWPGETITLRQGDRIIEDSRKTGFA